MKAKFAKFGNVGVFKWMSVSVFPSKCYDMLVEPRSDSISVISEIDAMIKGVPYTDIIGFIIYDLPGRDCAAGASRGELQIGSIARYKSEYIDRIYLPCSLINYSQLILLKPFETFFLPIPRLP